MSTALYLSPWGILSDGVNHTQIDIDHPLPLYCKLEDVTGTTNPPPDPNLCAVQFTGGSQSDPAQVATWLAAVAADNDYATVWRIDG